MRKKRLEKILANLAKENLQQMIICDPATIFYLTGVWIHPGERLLALYIAEGKTPVFMVNSLFMVPEDLPVQVVFYSDVEDGVEILSTYTDHQAVMGIDKEWPARFLLRYMECTHSTCVNASFAPDNVRIIKEKEEQDHMREASRLNDYCMGLFQKLLYEGVTEKQVAEKITQLYMENGADGLSFPPIVAFGANAADAHHVPDDTPLQKGDSVILDVGCVKNGYCSDMTRTVFFDHVSPEDIAIYDLVRKANEEAEAMIKVGVRRCDIDKTARDIISDAGYGENFTHRLGHSIGFECHEAGDVSSINTDPVAEGMIFSVEPGVYLVGQMGVRIEDLVLVTADGIENLNHYPKDLVVIK